MRPHYSTEFYPLALGTITVAALGYITLGSKTFIRIEIANRTWHCFAALRLNTDRIECTHMPNFIYHFMIIQFSLKGKLPFFSFGLHTMHLLHTKPTQYELQCAGSLFQRSLYKRDKENMPSILVSVWAGEVRYNNYIILYSNWCTLY